MDQSNQNQKVLQKSSCKSQHIIANKNLMFQTNKITRNHIRQASNLISDQKSLHFKSDPIYQLIQQCITSVEMLKEKYKVKNNDKFFLIRSCAAPGQKMSKINYLIDSISNENNLLQNTNEKNLEIEIQIILNQLFEEKKSKQLAITQGESLRKQQEHSIKYLKSRIKQYKQMN